MLCDGRQSFTDQRKNFVRKWGIGEAYSLVVVVGQKSESLQIEPTDKKVISCMTSAELTEIGLLQNSLVIWLEPSHKDQMSVSKLLRDHTVCSLFRKILNFNFSFCSQSSITFPTHQMNRNHGFYVFQFED